MEKTSVRLEIKNHVAHVTLARPEVRNAFDPALIEQITRTFVSLQNQNDLVAVLLTGEGKSFCSGADLGYMQSMAKFSLDENVADANALFTMFETIRLCPHPVLARVQGHAMGGALGLIAACDIAAIEQGTLLCFSEVKLGLLPAVISTFVLERMTPSQARRYMLTGEVFGEQQAVTSGLAHFAGPSSEVGEFIDKMIATLRQNGPEAVRATKALLQNFSTLETLTPPEIHARQDLTVQFIAARRVSAEGQEGLQSFLTKREPNWRKT